MPEFVTLDYVKGFFKDKSICIVGGAPYVLEIEPGRIDSYDLVVRISNFPIDLPAVGTRVDVHYSFYGTSIGPSKEMLKGKGLKLHMCKLPNDRPKEIEHEWFVKNKKEVGIDYRYVYKNRKDFWVAPVYVPTTQEFLDVFSYLDYHQPTTGFACLYTLLKCPAREFYVTGFDFFTDKRHFTSKNQSTPQPWVLQNPGDPYRHDPDAERSMFSIMAKADKRVKLDKRLRRLINA